MIVFLFVRVCVCVRAADALAQLLRTVVMHAIASMFFCFVLFFSSSSSSCVLNWCFCFIRAGLDLCTAVIALTRVMEECVAAYKNFNSLSVTAKVIPVLVFSFLFLFLFFVFLFVFFFFLLKRCMWCSPFFSFFFFFLINFLLVLLLFPILFSYYNSHGNYSFIYLHVCVRMFVLLFFVFFLID